MLWPHCVIVWKNELLHVPTCVHGTWKHKVVLFVLVLLVEDLEGGAWKKVGVFRLVEVCLERTEDL